MGVILAAHDLRLDRDVALKIVLPQMLRSREIIERFSNEARSLAKLDSQHVVKVWILAVFLHRLPAPACPTWRSSGCAVRTSTPWRRGWGPITLAGGALRPAGLRGPGCGSRSRHDPSRSQARKPVRRQRA